MPRFMELEGLTIDQKDNLYVADDNSIRIINPLGHVSTLFKKITKDLQAITSLALDNNGNIYALNDTNRIQKITPTGCHILNFSYPLPYNLMPVDLAIDNKGNIFVLCTNHSIRSNAIYKITPDGALFLFAGDPTVSSHITKNGSGQNALFNEPQAITIDRNTNFILVAEMGHIRMITPSGDVTSITCSTIHDANAIAIDNSGNIYITQSNVIYKIMMHAERPAFITCIDILAKYNEDFNKKRANHNLRFSLLTGLIIDSKDNIYVSDKNNFVIRKITPEGNIFTFAGTDGVEGDEDSPQFPLHQSYFAPLTESEILARQSILNKRAAFDISTQTLMQKERTIIAANDRARLEAKLVRGHLKRKLTQRVLILKLHNNQEVNETSRQTAEWYKAKEPEWATQKIQIISMVNPAIKLLLTSLDEKDKGGNFVRPYPSITIAKNISTMVMSGEPNLFLAPLPAANDEYRIILVGHKYEILPGGESVLAYSPQALATFILAAVSIMSADFPVISPVIVSLVSCFSGESKYDMGTDTAVSKGMSFRPMASSVSVVGRIQKALLNASAKEAFKTLSFRLKGYKTLVSISLSTDISKFRRLDIKTIGPWDSSKRTALVRGRVFAHASFGGGRVDVSLANALTDTEDEE